MTNPSNKVLLAAILGTLGVVATPASAIDFNDLTFTSTMLPTDASTGGAIVVGYDAAVVFGGSRLSFTDTFLYEVAANSFSPTGIAVFGGAGTSPEISHDGTRVPGTIKSPDFGGNSGTTLDGPFNTAGVWTQDTGQPIGTGTLIDLLELDQPTPSYAQENWSQYDPINGNPPGYVPTAFDRNLGRSGGISGDGNIVTGTYYRRQMRDPVTNAVIFEGGGMPLAFDLSTSTAIAVSGEAAPAIEMDGQVLGADFDGNVLAGFTDNSKPTIWRDSVAYQQTSHPDGITGRAIAVSDDGNVVAGYQRVVMPDTAANTQGQVLWQYIAGTDSWRRTTIGRLPGRTEGLAEATGISGDGKIVVGYDDAKTLIQGGGIAGSGDNGQGTFWTQFTGLVNIEDFLSARGLDLTGIEIASIQGISPDGNTLVTWAYTGTSLSDITGLIIDVSSTPLNPTASQALLDTATSNLGTSAAYVGDNYYGDWTQDGMVTQEDLNLLDYLINGAIGDNDLDGDVDDADFGIAFAAFTGPNNGPSTNFLADLDEDGDVDDADFGLAFAAFTGPQTPANVPEPTSLALLGISGLLIARRRHA